MSLQVYTPYVCDIAAVESMGLFTLVTTQQVHTFVIGSLCAFQVPQAYGMRQLTGVKAYVFDVPDDQSVLLTLDSSNFDPFVIPSVSPPVVLDPAQIIPAGDANSGYSAPGGTLESLTIPGSYQGIVA